jgi:hypothetical protein
MEKENKDRLADLVQGATAETLQALTCPECGGSLTIQYTSRGKSALSVMCAQCGWRVVTDGLPCEPLWVRQVGPRVETGTARPERGEKSTGAAIFP